MLSIVKKYPNPAKAGLVFAVAFIGLISMSPEYTDSRSGLVLIIEIVGFVIFTGVGMAWLRYFRGPSKTSKAPPYLERPISTWGWLWRFSLSFFVGFIALAYLYIGAASLGASESSRTLIFFIGFCSHFFVTSFAFFGVSRKEKLIALIPMIRGY